MIGCLESCNAFPSPFPLPPSLSNPPLKPNTARKFKCSTHKLTLPKWSTKIIIMSYNDVAIPTVHIHEHVL